MEIRRHKEGVYRIYGDFTFYNVKEKSVVVDGELYTKRVMEECFVTLTDSDYDEVCFDLAKEYDRDLHSKGMYFDQLQQFGINAIFLQEPKKLQISFYDLIPKCIRYNYSTNTYINTLYYILNYLKPIEWIEWISKYYQKSGHCGRGNSYKNEYLGEIKSGIISIVLEYYGSGNKVELDMKIEDFLSYDIKKIKTDHSKIKSVFPKYSIDMSENEKLDFLINIIPNLKPFGV